LQITNKVIVYLTGVASTPRHARAGGNPELAHDRLVERWSPACAGMTGNAIALDDQTCHCQSNHTRGSGAHVSHSAILILAAKAICEHDGVGDEPQLGLYAEKIHSTSVPFEFGSRLNLSIPITRWPEVEQEQAGSAHNAGLRRIMDGEWRTRAHIRAASARWPAACRRARLPDHVIEQVERICEIAERLETARERTGIVARLLRFEEVSR